MEYKPNRPPRRSPRLKGYDYSQNGAYFVTICTQNRELLFGEIVGGEMQLNSIGEIAQIEWLQTAVVRSNIELDAFVVMPNHVHGIILIADDSVGTQHAVSLQTRQLTTFGKLQPGSLSTIIRSYKSAVTKRINELRETPGATVWQGRYYDHIIRNEAALNSIREYIYNNPARWGLDNENPAYVRKM
jgi:REP element-mobilizing transposase RayT